MSVDGCLLKMTFFRRLVAPSWAEHDAKICCLLVLLRK